MKTDGSRSACVFLSVSLLAIGAFYVGCKNPARPDPETTISATSSSCIPNSAYGVAKTSHSMESIFEYMYTPSFLNVTFSIGAYCGRHENGFIVTHLVEGDTLTITVRDTISGGPWCTCLYLINAQIIGLTKNRYIVRCKFADPQWPNGQVYHQVEIWRGKSS